MSQLQESLTFYTLPGPITDPGIYAALLDRLPADVPSLVAAMQGLLVHIFWAERHGLQLDDKRKSEVNLRRVDSQFARLLALDDRPLDQSRPPAKRLVGNCRDFSTLTVAILRHKGVPARARCGFGTYFLPHHNEDHWVIEWWHPEQGRWVMTDAQIDALQRQVLELDFDPLDMPPGKFLTGGEAWQSCRAGKADPDSFGIFDMHGMWFIRGDLLRDLLALNKVEILPWDHWGLMSKRDEELAQADLELLDRAAALCLPGANDLATAQAFASMPGIAMPDEWAKANDLLPVQASGAF